MAKSDGNNDNDTVSKECVFKTIASEASGLYNLLITISTGIFGGTLLFLEKIAPSPTILSLVFLFLGWCSLGISIVLCAVIRWKNIESGRMFLEDKIAEAREIDKPNRWRTVAAITTLITGMALVGCFGAVNMINRVNSAEGTEEVISEKGKTGRCQKEKIIERSIPYDSVDEPKQ